MSQHKKRPAPTEEVPDGAAFNLGDIEAEYGKAGTKFKAPRYRKPKEVTEAAKNIGSVQYQKMYDKAAWFTGVIPFLASPKKLPAPRSNKIAMRTEEGFEADQAAMGASRRTDSQLMPPPTSAPTKRFTPQELRQVDLSICMNRIYEQGDEEDLQPHKRHAGASEDVAPSVPSTPVPEGVSTTLITTNSTTVTREADCTTITSEQMVSARSSIPSYMPSPLRSALDGTYLPSLPIDDLRLSSSFTPYSPMIPPGLASPAPHRDSALALSELAEVSSEALLHKDSSVAPRSRPPSRLQTPQPSPRRVPEPSPFRSPSQPDFTVAGDCSELVDLLPRLTPLLRSSPANTPLNMTPNEYAANNSNTDKPPSQDYVDLLLAHFNAEWASQASG
jgi:hypothetical protein